MPGSLISDNILIAQEMFHGLRTNKVCQRKYMVIKTDISKAYDGVEWDFIYVLLQKLGLSHFVGAVSGFTKWLTTGSHTVQSCNFSNRRAFYEYRSSFLEV